MMGKEKIQCEIFILLGFICSTSGFSIFKYKFDCLEEKEGYFKNLSIGLYDFKKIKYNFEILDQDNKFSYGRIKIDLLELNRTGYLGFSSFMDESFYKRLCLQFGYDDLHFNAHVCKVIKSLFLNLTKL